MRAGQPSSIDREHRAAFKPVCPRLLDVPPNDARLLSRLEAPRESRLIEPQLVRVAEEAIMVERFLVGEQGLAVVPVPALVVRTERGRCSILGVRVLRLRVLPKEQANLTWELCQDALDRGLCFRAEWILEIRALHDCHLRRVRTRRRSALRDPQPRS